MHTSSHDDICQDIGDHLPEEYRNELRSLLLENSDSLYTRNPVLHPLLSWTTGVDTLRAQLERVALPLWLSMPITETISVEDVRCAYVCSGIRACSSTMFLAEDEFEYHFPEAVTLPITVLSEAALELQRDSIASAMAYFMQSWTQFYSFFTASHVLTVECSPRGYCSVAKRYGQCPHVGHYSNVF
jgi:hypothetical protein